MKKAVSSSIAFAGSTSTRNAGNGAWGRVILVSAILLSLVSCNAFQSYIGREVGEQPAKLTSFEAQRELDRLWSVKVGDGQGEFYNQLHPAIDREFIYAASANGTVVAVNRESGDTQWRNRTDENITGAVGAGSGLVMFGTRDAEVFALDQFTGNILWQAPVSSEVLSAPQTNGNVVVLQTVDGKLIALDAGNGTQRWTYETNNPALTLRGASDPVIVNDTVIAGFANGLIVAVDADNGFLQWEERVAVPQGRYDIDRVIDIDGQLMVSGTNVFATSYQGNLMGFDIQTGRIVWGTEASSFKGLAQGFGNLYYVSDESELIALRNNSEEVVWQNDQLRLRQLTAPKTTGNYVVVADFEGYVHLISQIDGRFAARTRVDGDGVRAELLADGNSIYVYGNSGRLTAYAIR
ncbi:MAG: outer membrane protein assembly factor BamB [Pseudohongiellaceae bacterium]|nr:outer membrane protein assembly factor BamB [Pseudohongiellaceae bacterium]